MKERLHLKFHKYQGAGNDFVIIDSAENPQVDPLTISPILLNRHFSIGGDSLLYIEKSTVADIRMRVCEVDGSESSMCGNGLRCIGLYLRNKLSMERVTVEVSGKVKLVEHTSSNLFRVSMGVMQPIGDFINPISNSIVEKLEVSKHEFYVVSPSEPHAVTVVSDPYKIDTLFAVDISRKFSKFPFGINVNFVSMNKDHISVRTFERGIFGETLACGTGATSSAYVVRNFYGYNENPVNIKMKGGLLQVHFEGDEIFLVGEAVHVFSGEIDVEIGR